ncbi:MAG: 4'-phosphopantetheinyl transferase [Hyphomicrobiaceae bacterium]
MIAGQSARPSDPLEASLLAAMAAIAPPDLRIGCRLISAGDEAYLLPDELRAVTTCDPVARRASGAARHVAHELLAGLGHAGAPIGRESSGQPVWPEGIVGSLAHDDLVAVAVVASRTAVASVGIDVEAAEPLPSELSTLVVTDEDVPGPVHRDLAGRLVFAAKEACYKAAYPLDGVFLDHDDIAVDLAESRARTRTGIGAQLFWCTAPRVVVLAIVRIDRA